MIQFTALIKKFAQKGEKTGWTYIEVPAVIAQQLMPDNKKSFRVKGYLDHYAFDRMALIPMGEGHFIMPLSAATRKGIRKGKDATLQVKMELDKKEKKPPAELMECLKDEPKALAHFQKLAKSHQNYFTNWIESAKTEPTKTSRIAQAVNALSKQYDFGTMIRSIKANKAGRST